MKLHSSMLRNFWKALKLEYTVFYIRFFGEKPENKDPSSIVSSKIKNILIIRLDKVGDLILSTPVLANLRQYFPGARITALVRSYNSGVLKNNPNVDRVVIINDKDAVKFLFREEIDLALNLIFDFDLESAYYCYRSNAEYRVGYRYPKSSYFYNIEVDRDPISKYELLRNLDILKALKMSILIKESSIYPSLADKKYCEEALKSLGIRPGEILIGLNPGTGRKRREWPSEKFILLGREILKKSRVKVLVFWGKADRKRAQKIVLAIGEGALLAPQSDITSLAEIMKHLKVFVCGNTGPAHVAMASKTPLVGLYGKDDQLNWTPADKKDITVVQAAKCSEIEVKDVLESVGKYL